MTFMSLDPQPEYREVVRLAVLLEALGTLCHQALELFVGLPGADVEDARYVEYLESFGTAERFYEHALAFGTMSAMIEHARTKFADCPIAMHIAEMCEDLNKQNVPLEGFVAALQHRIGGVGGPEGLDMLVRMVTRIPRLLSQVQLAARLIDETADEVKGTNQYLAWSQREPLSINDLLEIRSDRKAAFARGANPT